MGSVRPCCCVSLAQDGVIRLMDKILHDPKDPKLWELWYIPYYGYHNSHSLGSLGSCRILSISRNECSVLLYDGMTVPYAEILLHVATAVRRFQVLLRGLLPVCLLLVLSCITSTILLILALMIRLLSWVPEFLPHAKPPNLTLPP